MSFRSWSPGMLWLCLSAALVLPQARPSRQPPARPAYMAQLASFDQSSAVTRVTLKDGTRALVLESHSMPVVSILTVYQSGYGDEPAELEGVAGLLQQIVLRRSSASTTGGLSKDLQALGGVLHPAVDYDQTSYEIVVPAAQWKKALEIQTKLVSKPEWSDEEFAKERDRFLDEATHRIIGKEEAAYERMLALAYPDSPIGHFASISPLGLESLTQGKLKEYARRTYSPDRTIMVISGDVITSEVLTQIVQLYGKGPKAASARRAPPQVKQETGFGYLQDRMNIALPLICLGFRTAPVSAPDYPALEILSAILSTGEGSVVNRRLRDQKKVILSARGDLAGYSDWGFLGLRMVVDPKNIDRCEIAAFTEFEILKQEKPDAEEVARAVAQLETRYWSGLQTVSEKARTLAGLECRGSWKGMDSYVTRLRKVTADDVQRVAQKYLRLEDAVLVECLPLGHEERKLTSESALELLRDLLKASTEQELAERERATKPAYEIPGPAPEFKLSELVNPWRKASILRGPELYVREDHTQPLIYMGFYYPGGKLFENQENSGITALMLYSMLRATEETSAEWLYRQLEIYGARVLTVVDEDYFGTSVTVASANIEPALELLIKMFKSPKFEADEIARQKEILLAKVKQQKSDIKASLRNEMDQVLFRGHPYSLGALGTEASLTSLAPEAVRSWYEKTVRYHKPIIIIMGDTRGTSLAEYFVENFSGSRYQDTPIPEAFPKPPDKAGKSNRDWGGPRTLALIGFQAPPYGDEDSYPSAVLQQYLAGAADDYFARISARQARAYSFSVGGDSGLRGGQVTACASGPAADTDKIVEALGDEVGRLVNLEMSYRDFRSARQAALAAFEIDRQLRATQIRNVVHSVLAGRGVEGLEDYTARLQEVRQEDLAEVAKRFFNKDKSVTVVFRGMASP